MNSTLLTALHESWIKSPFPSSKISSYFPAYVEAFGHLVNTRCVFIETGILDGGSLFMWQEWLGPSARVIGVDLNPAATKWREHGFEIFIGDQGDPAFWENILSEIGHFDALLDDGGHQSFQQIVTAISAIKSAPRTCVVAIEDTATSFMSDFSAHGKFSFLSYAKAFTDILTGRIFSIYKGRFPNKTNENITKEFNNVYSVQFYAGIVVFHINQDYSNTPTLIKNRPSNGASDFRYEGVKSAVVSWPTLLAKKRTVKVKGGQTGLAKFKTLITSILPKQIKIALKKNIVSRS